MTGSRDLVVERAYPAAWRALPDLPLLATEQWHRAMSGRFDGEPVWLWTPSREGGVAVGLGGFVVTRADAYVYGNAAALLTDPDSPFASAEAAARLAQRQVDPAALLGHLLVTFPGYSTFPVGTARDDPRALRRCLGAVRAWASGGGLAAVALPYVESASPLAGAAAELGFSGWRLSEDSALDVPEAGFTGYLASMRSHRRQRIRAERRSLHDRGIRGRHVPAPDERLLERMAELRVLQRRKYGLTGDLTAERARLAEIMDALGGRVDVFVVEQHAPSGERSAPISFSLLVRDGATWHGLAVGSDYDDPRSRSTYFEVAYYAPLDVAADFGVQRISYGLAASRAKSLRGCAAQPVDCLLAGLTPSGQEAVEQLHAAWAAPRSPATAGAAG